jgi:hypothetical protein
MALYSDNLYSLVGRVRAARPLAGEEQIRQWVNNAIRNVINKRTYWVELRKLGVIPVPNQTISGNISLTPGSNIALGSGASWPTNDVVNTTLADPVFGPGYQEVALASSAGVTQDSILWIDDGTPSAEAVPVMRINTGGFGLTTIIGAFQFAHPVGATVTQSSLVQQQLRTGYNDPIFTILAVSNVTLTWAQLMQAWTTANFPWSSNGYQGLILDNTWGGTPRTAVDYYILKMYYTLFPNIRKIIGVVDQQQGIPLDVRRTQQELDITDPQRTDNSDPLCFVSAWPNPNGNMQWEVWPCPTSARQIKVLATLQWPELVNPEDLPPFFLEPTIFTNFAIAEGLMHKLSKDDPFFDPKLSQQFDMKAQQQLQDALIGDEDRAIMDYKSMLDSMFPLIGANSQFSLSHAVSAVDFSY